ncbi:CBS domain-containing protein [Paenibacillus sp. GCM10027627]|uniref:CBS domain-containing protein n=1 Tax=unclassified Paenibacillus TaxID=185978 RepID=UPI00363DB4FA
MQLRTWIGAVKAGYSIQTAANRQSIDWACLPENGMERGTKVRQVRELMSTHCKTVTLQDNVYEIALLMAQYDIGFVLVVDGDDSSKLIGVVTDRDLVIRGYASKRPGSCPVSDVMSDSLVTVSPDEDAEEAADLMASHQIRRLPVVENGKLVGVITLGDLALGSTTGRDAGHALSEISVQHHHAFH